jgi:DNA-binding NarL/FixJ family response regulator
MANENAHVPGEWLATADALRDESYPEEPDSGSRIPLRVLVLEPDALAAFVLMRTFERAGGIALLGMAQTAQEAIEKLVSDDVDVLIRDLDKPGEDERGEGDSPIAAFLRERGFDIPVVMIYSHLDVMRLREPYEEGARGWVQRNTVTRLLPGAIHAVAGGGCWMEPELAREAFEALSSLSEGIGHLWKRVMKYEGPLAELTEREKAVLRALGHGRSNRQIAEEDHVSVHTIKRHVSSILHKLQVDSREKAVRLAKDLGFS